MVGVYCHEHIRGGIGREEQMNSMQAEVVYGCTYVGSDNDVNKWESYLS